jgi:hypothetical protein
MSFLKESDIEDIAFRDMNLFIGPTIKKRRQEALGLKKVKTSRGFSTVPIAKPDMYAETINGVKYVFEVKKFKSTRDLVKACGQLMHYRYLLGNIPIPVLVCDHFPEDFDRFRDSVFPSIALFEVAYVS